MAAPFAKETSWRARIRCFHYAWRGLRLLVATQWNARIHLAITLGMILAAWFFEVTTLEWCALIIAAMIVWSTEALNTAVEFAVDLVSPEHHPLAEKAKDVAAGAVLVSAAGALIIGIAILGPRCTRLLLE